MGNDVVAERYPYYSSHRTWGHGIVLPAIQKFLNGGSGRLLDLGCGNGALIAELDVSRYSVFGVDFSPSGIAIAQQRHIGDFRLIDATTDPVSVFGKNSFEAIISVEVIEHIYDPMVFLVNAYNLLASGGKILLTTPYNGWLKNVVIAVSGGYDQHHSPFWTGGHIKFWSRKTLTKALLAAGFHDIEFSGAGRLPFLWKSMILTAVK